MMRWPLVVLLIAGVLGLIPQRAAANPSEGLPAIPTGIDRATPRAAVRTFLEAARTGDFARAAYALDVRALPRAGRQTAAMERARRLLIVLEREVRLDLARVSEEPAGDRSDGLLTDRLGEIATANGKTTSIELARVQAGHELVWVFSNATVQDLPSAFEARGISWAQGLLPPVLIETVLFGAALWEWLVFLLAIPVAFLVSTIALWLAALVSRRTRMKWDDELFNRIRSPLRWLLVLVVIASVVDELGFVASTAMALSRLLVVLAILAGGWVLYRLVDFAAWFIEERAQRGKGAPSEFRSVQTQVRVLKRVVQVVLIIVVVSVALLEFQSVRSIGVSLLASAGIVGVVIGLAAQKPVAALLAGIQVSLTRPVVIGDAVVFEGQFGTVEEIRLTYVVVKLWDERRLVIPMARLLEQPFENWTKVSSELLGTVFIRVDLALPIELLRTELDQILRGTELWDERAKSVQVTELQERMAEVRIVLSAADPPSLWNLRCHVREKLMEWLARHENGRYLPRLRIDGQLG